MKKKCSPNDSFQRLSRVGFLCCAFSASPLDLSLSIWKVAHQPGCLVSTKSFLQWWHLWRHMPVKNHITLLFPALCYTHKTYVSGVWKQAGGPRREAWMEQAERELASLPVIEFLIYSLLFSILSFRHSLAQTAWDKMEKENNRESIFSFSRVELMTCSSASET